jgi:hypothetical protein
MKANDHCGSIPCNSVSRIERKLAMATNPKLFGQNSETGVLASLIQTRRDDLSRDTAEYLLSLQFDERDVSRMNERSEMARSGSLSEAEAAELDSYIHASNLLAVIRSKAKQSLHTTEE